MSSIAFGRSVRVRQSISYRPLNTGLVSDITVIHFVINTLGCRPDSLDKIWSYLYTVATVIAIQNLYYIVCPMVCAYIYSIES